MKKGLWGNINPLKTVCDPPPFFFGGCTHCPFFPAPAAYFFLGYNNWFPKFWDPRATTTALVRDFSQTPHRQIGSKLVPHLAKFQTQSESHFFAQKIGFSLLPPSSSTGPPPKKSQILRKSNFHFFATYVLKIENLANRIHENAKNFTSEKSKTISHANLAFAQKRADLTSVEIKKPPNITPNVQKNTSRHVGVSSDFPHPPLCIYTCFSALYSADRRILAFF